MRLIEIKLRNFMRFRKASLRLDNAGMVLIEGVNKDDESASSNGAGKSTIADALVWALYGVTTHEQGVEGDDVVNETVAANCGVEVVFELRDATYQVTRRRAWKKGGKGVQLLLTNKTAKEGLTKGTIRDTQAVIDKLIGMSSMTFRHACVFGQGRAYRFSKLSDSEKKAVFDEMLGSELYGKASTIAGERAASSERNLISAESAAKSHRDAIVEARERLGRIRRNAHRASVLARKAAKRALREVAEIESKLSSIADGAQIETLKRTAEKATEAFAKSTRELDEATAAGKSARMHHASLDASRSKTARSESTECHACRQTITGEHVKRQLKELDAKLAEATDECAKYDEQIRWCKLEVENTRRVANEARRALDEAKEATGERRALEERRGAAMERANRKSDGDYTELLVEERRNLKKLKKRLATERAFVKEKRVELAALRFWQHGFGAKGLRSLLLDSVLPYLNAKLESYTNALTAGNIAVEFRTQRVLKGGGLREDFHVHVSNKHGSSKYNMNSIGERAKIDIIVGLALQDMAASRSCVPVNVAFFDEVFDGLDAQGVDRVVQVLSQLKRESAFVISHNEGLKAFFTRRIRVVKENGESRIET